MQATSHSTDAGFNPTSLYQMNMSMRSFESHTHLSRAVECLTYHEAWKKERRFQSESRNTDTSLITILSLSADVFLVAAVVAMLQEDHKG